MAPGSEKNGIEVSSRQTFLDPWPAPDSLWSDPPWIMSGSSVTAWFETDAEAVRKLLSPSFLPLDGIDGVPTRLRFYDITFEPRDGSPEEKARGAGTFREAVIAFKGSIAQVDGEFSAWMWSNGDVYNAWGREVFGWPMVRAKIDIDGSLFDSGRSGQTTFSLVTDEFSLHLEVNDEPIEELSPGPSPNWLTPRRVLFPGGQEAERRDLLIVRPAVLQPGVFSRHAGNLSQEGGSETWISSLMPIGEVVVHSSRDFLISVGDSVETVRGA